MHIPKGTTVDTVVLPFSEALVGSQNKDYDAKQWLYVPDFYSEYRYVLGTCGQNPLICIGINPSTARPNALDPTLKSVQRIAHFNGFDSFLMFNVYAQRATRPDDMEEELNPYLHRENMEAFRYILSRSDAPPSVWAAWGTIIEKRAYLADCVRDMIEIGKAYRARWFTAGNRSKGRGHPHHPLYLKKETSLDLFDIEEYLGGFKSL